MLKLGNRVIMCSGCVIFQVAGIKGEVGKQNGVCFTKSPSGLFENLAQLKVAPFPFPVCPFLFPSNLKRT